MALLKIGDTAPSFELLNQNGETVCLANFVGKKMVIYFYPKDMTPGCTAQACNLTDNIDRLQKNGYSVLGVSADSVKRHKKFVDKYNLKFDLLADEEKEMINAYGVWGPKKFMGREYDGILRTTYIIGIDGKVERVIEKVKTKAHTAQILE